MLENTQISPLDKTGTLNERSKRIEEIESTKTQTSLVVTQESVEEKSFTPLPPALNAPDHSMYLAAIPSTKRQLDAKDVLRARCRQLGVSVFFQENTSVRSLGFTSAIPGEGKTFLAKLTAEVMAEENDVPVTLIECNWEHPTLSEAYNLTPGPGLSDLLLGRCPLGAVRRQVRKNLTVIPAGDDVSSAAKLLRELQQKGVYNLMSSPDEVLILDLPATTTTAYGPLAAHLADALILVVRMGVTPEPFVAEACNYLKYLPVQGIILIQVLSRIPSWLRRIL